MWLTVCCSQTVLTWGSLRKVSSVDTEFMCLQRGGGGEGRKSVWVNDSCPDHWENFLSCWVYKCLSLLAIVFLIFPLLTVKRKEKKRGRKVSSGSLEPDFLWKSSLPVNIRQNLFRVPRSERECLSLVSEGNSL